MILTTLRTAITTQIGAALGASVKEVKPHGGRFSLAELKALAARSPSVRVACLGISEIRPVSAGVEAVTTWAAYVVAGDLPGGQARDAVALALVGSLAVLIAAEDWDLASVDGARSVRADNLFSREIDRNGIALWALTWRHEVTLGAVDLATLDDFLTAHVDYDLAPTDGVADATDNIALPQ
jgi:phage gp37-like protein